MGLLRRLCLAGVLIGALAGSTKADLFKVNVSSDNIPGSSMYVKHYVDSVDGLDIYDHNWANAPSNPNDQWMKVFTSPYLEPLDKDSRGLDSLTDFDVTLSAIDKLGTGFTANNTRFKFSFTEGPDVERPDYLYSIICGTFTESGSVNDIIANHSGYTDPFTYDGSIGATLILTPTPEPATLALLGLGAATLIAGGRRKRKRAE